MPVAGPHDDRVVDRGRQLVLHRLRLVGAGQEQPGAPRDLLEADGRLHGDVAHRAHRLVRDRSLGGGRGRRHRRRLPAVVAAGQQCRDTERDRGEGGGQPGRDEGAPPPAAAYGAGQGGQQRVRQRFVGGRVLEQARVDAVQEPGEPGDLPHGAGAALAAGQVPLERQAVARAQGAQHVRRAVVCERAGHALTPISSSASRSARSA